MLNEKQINLIIERLVRRITQGNSYILKKISKQLNKIKNVDDDKIYQLQQELKYGKDFDDVVGKLKEVTELNVKDIKKIFMEVARKNQQFAKKYYDYQNIEMTPLDENESLKQTVESYSNEVIRNYTNISDNAGYSLFNVGDILMFLPLAIAYQEMIDYAILKRSLGKQVFIQEIELQVKKLAKSGLKTYNLSDNKTYRIDNVLKMDMQRGIRDMTNDLQQQFGEEYGADGIEISVHEYPAPDHAEVQGHQFTDEEFEKFQNDMDATDINGVVFTADFDGRDRRAIGEYNCYHYVFHVLLGVDKQQYSNDDLKKMIKRNDKGFDFEDKHYTMYEGTQLQNKLKREMQDQYNTKMMAHEIGDKELEEKTDKKLNALSSKYKELSDVSGLPTEIDKLREWGYKRHQSYDELNNLEKYKMNINDDIEFVEKIDLYDSKMINKKINEYRENIIDKNVEHGYLIDKNGYVFHKKGKNDEVRFPKWVDYEDGIFVHNHPTKETNYSFSPKDIDLFARGNLKEIYGDDLEYTYMARRNESITLNDNQEIYREWDKLLKETEELSKNKKIDIDKNGFDYIVKGLSKKYNFIYKRSRQNIK